FVPTYFPDAVRPEEATVIRPLGGQRMEDMGIKMVRSPSFCIEGTTDVPDSPQGRGFFIQTLQPSTGRGSNAGGAGAHPIGGKLEPDGRLRICGLAKGDYRLTVYSGDKNF